MDGLRTMKSRIYASHPYYREKPSPGIITTTTALGSLGASGYHAVPLNSDAHS
jgi:hypothetical protein